MTYQPQRFAAPDGTEMVVLTAADYDRLTTLASDGADLVEAGEVLKLVERGEGTMPAEVLSLMLDQGLSPLGAWRRYRGLSQAALARRAGLSQVWIGRIEGGGGHGTPATRRKLAAALDAPTWALEDSAETSDAKRSTSRGAKYVRLRDHLLASEHDELTFSFEDIAGMVDGLPKSASTYREWWANHDGNSQALGWMQAGYMAEADLPHRTVIFRKTDNGLKR